MPEDFAASMRQLSDTREPAAAPSKVAIEVSKVPKSKGAKDNAREWLRDVGPTVTGLFSLIVALGAAFYAHQINSRQNEIKEAENRAAAAKLRAEVFKELNEKDPATRTLAVIRLAEYGKEVLEPLKMALGVKDDTIREGAADVVLQIFLSEIIKPEELFTQLRQNLKAKNSTLRKGVLQCYVKIGRRLPAQESLNVVGLLKQLDLGADCSYPEDENFFLQIPIFLDYWPSADSRDMLLAIAANSSCLRPRLKAIENLPTAARVLSLQDRNAIIESLRKLETTDAPESLRQSIAIATKQIEAIQGA